MGNHRWRYLDRHGNAECVRWNCEARKRAPADGGGYSVGSEVVWVRPHCPAVAPRAAGAVRAPPPSALPAVPGLPGLSVPVESYTLGDGRHFRYALPPGGLRVAEVRRLTLHLLTLTDDWPDGPEVPRMAGALFLVPGDEPAVAAAPEGDLCLQ